VIPILKQILAINPKIKILGSPWCAPAWMQITGNVKGFKPECYGAYAKYFAKYVQGMKAQGIHIDAITAQNEPLNEKNTPSFRNGDRCSSKLEPQHGVVESGGGFDL
jgi:glucosylceramidase